VQRDAQWENIFDSIKKIKAFSVARGIEFVLSVYPWAHQISDTEWVPGRYAFMPENAVASDKSVSVLKEFAKADGIELMDAYPEFYQYHGAEPLYFSHDMHWTPVGNGVMARALEKNLEQRYNGLWCR
jgi:hypothetical protein